MASRFALVIVLAKIFEPAEVGQFGLFLATVTLSMLIIGGEFYTYSQRELITLPKKDRSFVIQHQLIAIGLLYIFLLPPQLLIFHFDLLPMRFMYWFLGVLVVEHISQEINRLLVAMQRPVLASWVLYVRMGSWVACVIPVIWLYPDYRKLEFLFGSWFAGASLAIIIGSVVIYRESRPWERVNVDWMWIRTGFKVAALFLIATASFKMLTTVDRYIVEYLSSLDVLGAYVLFAGMAMAVVNFLDPAVFSFLYPRAVSAYRQKDFAVYKKVMKEMIWSALGVALILVTAVIVLTPFVLDWIGKETYQQNISILWVLLTVSTVYGVSMIPHYGLYAKGADHCIAYAHISSLIVFIITVYIISPYTPLLATAYSLLAAFVWIGIVKTVCYYKYTQDSVINETNLVS